VINDSLRGRDVRRDSLDGTDINENSLGTVPDAAKLGVSPPPTTRAACSRWST
jgi:hypothetical protein